MSDYPTWQDIVAEECRKVDRQPERDTSAEETSFAIGYRDGFSRAVQLVDEMTGGDGEYRYFTAGGERHCPDPEAMILRIVARLANQGGHHDR